MNYFIVLYFIPALINMIFWAWTLRNVQLIKELYPQAQHIDMTKVAPIGILVGLIPLLNWYVIYKLIKAFAR